MKANPLQDRDFLKKLDGHRNKVIYAKITSLTWEEDPIEFIEGQVASGNISIDGASACRRTCSLTMSVNPRSAQDIKDFLEVNNTYDQRGWGQQFYAPTNDTFTRLEWSLDTKFRLEIGLENTIDDEYAPIIWFPQGTFIITQFTQTLNEQGYSVSITGKDKMCLLDGTIGGNVFATHDFGKLYVWDRARNVESKEYIPIFEIVREMIHTYAREPYHNIIINDLDDVSVELIQMRAKNVIVYFYEIYENEDYTGSYTTQMLLESKNNPSALGKLFAEAWESNDPDGIYCSAEGYYYKVLLKGEYGDTIGYRSTELTYAGDLIANVGETITSVLDKIVKMLGEFEYFYDVDGHFIFQRKKIYHNINFTNEVTIDKEKFHMPPSSVSQYSYEFTGSNIISSFQNAPKISNLKNDYSIWGEKTSGDNKYKIHLRWAIDEKPTIFEAPGYYEKIDDKIIEYDAVTYEAGKEFTTREGNTVILDWRDLIYEMAYLDSKKDYSIQHLRELIDETTDLKQIQAYEKQIFDLDHLRMNHWAPYYADILEFWPEIHNIHMTVPDIEDYKTNVTANPTISIPTSGNWVTRWQDTQANDSLTDEEKAAKLVDLYNEFADVAGLRADINLKIGYNFVQYRKDYNEYLERKENQFWSSAINAGINEDGELEYVINEPGSLIFWFDFFNNEERLRPFRVSKIGRRSKVVNDTQVKAIFYKEIPNVMFVDPDEEDLTNDTQLNYVHMNIPDSLNGYLTLSTRGKSAKDALDELLYDNTFYQDQITINGVPVYYLEPNTRIKVYDSLSGIDGDYFVTKISYSLGIDGLMSVTGTKINEDIL